MNHMTSQQQQEDGSVGEAERTGIVDNPPDRAQQLQQPQQHYQPIQQQENPQLFHFQNNAERDEFSRYLRERHRIFSHGRVRRPSVDPDAENLRTEELIRIRHLIGILQNRTGGSDGEDEISTAPVRPQLFSRAANISDENPQEIAEFFRIHEPLAEMFPDLDLGRIFAEYGHMTTDGLASFIVENMEQMPRKKKSSTDETLVKQGGRQANNKSDSDAETGSGTGDDDYMGDLLADKMFGEMLQILRKEANNDEYQIPSEKEKELKDFLQQRFQIRSEFVKLMSRAFNWNVVPVILACFILQNGYGKLLMKATKMSDQFWETHLKPMQVNRKCVNKKRKFSQTITDAFGRFTAILEEFRERYPALICSDNMRITMDAATIPWEHPVEQMIECLVCFEEFPLSRVLFCTEILASTDFVDSVSADPGPSGLSADQISANQHAVEAEATANVTEGFSSAETSLIGAPSPPSTAQRNAGGAEDNISLAQIPESEEIATYEPETEMRTTESPFPQQMIIDDREEDEYLETDGLNNGANEETPISIEDYEDSSDRDEIIVVDQSMETEENGSNSIGGCSSSSSSSGDEIQIISDNELSPSTELNEERNVASHNDNIENAHPSESQPLSQSQILPSASQPMYHSFCRECVRGSARAATTEIPLAPGGQGLCCMVSNCAHILPYSKVKNIINKELRTKLEERIMEENLGMASIQNLERCQKCNFAMEIEDPVEVNKVFDCWKCKTKTCRVCGSEWEEHFGLTCEELDVKLKRDRQSRDIEKRMNEAIVRNCPKCHTAFVKESGCNHMTCRCGLEMCYLCRKVITKKHQSHFCSCPHQRRDLKIQDWKCPDCHRTCLMFEDYRFHDQRAIDQIRVESGIQLQQQTTTSSTSTAAQAENQQTLPDLLNWDLERSRLENQLAEIRQQRRATAEAFREGQTDGVNSNRTQHQQIMAELHQRQSQLYDELFRLQRDRHRHHQRDEHIINLRYQTELLRARHIRRQIRQMENGELGTIHNQPPEELFEQFRNAISNVQLNTQLQRAITAQADELCASNPQLNSDRTVTSVPNFSLQQEHNIRGEPNRAPAEAENRQNQNFPGANQRRLRPYMTQPDSREVIELSAHNRLSDFLDAHRLTGVTATSGSSTIANTSTNNAFTGSTATTSSASISGRNNATLWNEHIPLIHPLPLCGTGANRNQPTSHANGDIRTNDLMIQNQPLPQTRFSEINPSVVPYSRRTRTHHLRDSASFLPRFFRVSDTSSDARASSSAQNPPTTLASELNRRSGFHKTCLRIPTEPISASNVTLEDPRLVSSAQRDREQIIESITGFIAPKQPVNEEWDEDIIINMGTNNEIRGEINATSTDRPEAELINRNTHGIPTEQFERSVPAEGIRLNRNRRLNSADNDAAELEMHMMATRHSLRDPRISRRCVHFYDPQTQESSRINIRQLLTMDSDNDDFALQPSVLPTERREPDDQVDSFVGLALQSPRRRSGRLIRRRSAERASTVRSEEVSRPSISTRRNTRHRHSSPTPTNNSSMFERSSPPLSLSLVLASDDDSTRREGGRNETSNPRRNSIIHRLALSARMDSTSPHTCCVHLHHHHRDEHPHRNRNSRTGLNPTPQVNDDTRSSVTATSHSNVTANISQSGSGGEVREAEEEQLRNERLRIGLGEWIMPIIDQDSHGATFGRERRLMNEDEIAGSSHRHLLPVVESGPFSDTAARTREINSTRRNPTENDDSEDDIIISDIRSAEPSLKRRRQ